MASGCVLISESGMDGALSGALGEACRTVGVPSQPWRRGAGSPHEASLLVGYLPVGEKKLPEDAVFAATHAYPGLPLLMLSPQTLLRDVVVLADGRVTVMGLPLTAGRIAERLQIALAPRPVPAGEAVTGIQVRVSRGAGWWAAALCRGAPETFTTPTAPASVVLDVDPQGALAAAVAADPASGTASESLRAALAGGEGSAGAGCGGAVARLEVPAGRWNIACASGAAAVLMSPLRIPPVWNSPGDGALRSFPAAAGDVLVLCSDCSRSPWPQGPFGDGSDGEAAAFARRGGPALLDHMRSRLSGGDWRMHCVIAEVW